MDDLMLREKIRNMEGNDLFNAVRDDVLLQEDIKDYLRRVIDVGCRSGVVTSLIYYYQTEKFFDTHVDDIFELHNELLKETGYYLKIELSRNDLAWLAYEENVIKFFNDLFF